MSSVYVGQITPFAGNFAIKGSAMCSGQLLPINQYQAVFAILGTYYGGNGTSNFALPDLRGRRMNSQGQPPGMSFYNIGQMSGTEHVTATLNNLPAHTHTVTGNLNVGGAQPKANSDVGVAGGVLGHTDDISGNSQKAQPAIYCPAGTATPIALAGVTGTANPSGGSQPLGILNPSLTITMLIWLIGVFPSRN